MTSHSHKDPAVELFDPFFESKEESISPFLTPNSRKWGKNLTLKSSLSGAFFLALSFLFSFFLKSEPLSHFFLLLTFFFAGTGALISALEDLFNLEINIDVLMTLAAFLSVLIGSGQEGALLLVLFSFSGGLEEGVQNKAKGAISSLRKILPQKAFALLDDGSLIERSVKDIKIGEKIHVKAGQIVPLDGQVIEGSSSLNLSHLTGESHPLSRGVGDLLPAGALNLDGALTLKITHTSSDSTLARIIEQIISAQSAKPKLQRWIDKVSKKYATSIIGLACFFALLLPLFFSIPFLGSEGSIYRALAFLIAASPCALILAIPIAYLSAISSCAKQGILLKGGAILDALAKCKTIAFDKTGTLTTGELSLVGFEIVGQMDEKEAMSVAYALELSSFHPMAKAVCSYAQKQKLSPAKISQFRSVAGFGLEGLYQENLVYIGNEKWIFSKIAEEVRFEIQKKISQILERGELFTLLILKESVAIFRFKDELRPNIQETLKTLKEKWNMHLVMLTGDHETSASLMAKEAGLTEFHANLLPEEKLNYIAKHDNLVMVGDGINDGPALARASVGISMGKVGSGAAIDASDIVFLQDNIEKLGWLIKKSKEVSRIVKQNLGVAAAAILCASIPSLFGWVPLWLAVILHEGGTVLVGLNALRLLKKR